jgi:hypothetical protein
MLRYSGCYGTGCKPVIPERGLAGLSRSISIVKTRDWWFFGDTVDIQGLPLRVSLFHAASVRIVRHIKVRSGLNPYDPSWTPYLSRRYAVAPHRARS